MNVSVLFTAVCWCWVSSEDGHSARSCACKWVTE